MNNSSKICHECGRKFISDVALVSHIVSKHDRKQYYDKWIKTDEEGKCLKCGNPTEFSGRWSRGYKKFCSRKCQDEYVMNDPKRIEKANKTQKETIRKKYGVDWYTQTDEFKEKSKATNKERYNDETYNNSEKAKRTFLLKYGVENPAQAEFVKDKIRKTNLKKYGGSSHMHNDEIFHKVEINSFKSRLHPSGVYYRGNFEKDFLDNFSRIIKIENGKGIKYNLDEKERTYYPDFYIPELNLIIEIKNGYLLKRDQVIINAKEKACRKAGFDYLLINNKDYREFLHYLST
jgi:hypothetical protein